MTTATQSPSPMTQAPDNDLIRVAAGRQTDILGCRLSLLAGQSLARQIADWAAEGTSGYVCVSNTHMVVQAQTDAELYESMRDALAVTTDSQVLGNALARLDRPYPDTILYGPDLMQAVIASAEAAGQTIALFGSTEQTCQAVNERMAREHPRLKCVAIECPPVANLEELSSDAALAKLIDAKPDIVLVSLGCPKQECWMRRVSGKLPAVMIGLGGAFDFYGGVRQRSPEWVHRYSLEWLYRMLGDPRRLLTRYLVNNPQFIWLWIRAKLRNARV